MHMSLKCIVSLYVIKYIIVNDCFVICVGSSLLSKTVDVTYTSDHFQWQATRCLHGHPSKLHPFDRPSIMEIMLKIEHGVIAQVPSIFLYEGHTGKDSIQQTTRVK